MQSQIEKNTEQLGDSIFRLIERFVQADYTNQAETTPDYSIEVYTTTDHGEQIVEWTYKVFNPALFPVDDAALDAYLSARISN